MKNDEAIQKCFEQICKNNDIVASLCISEPIRAMCHPDLDVFLDIHTETMMSFHDLEIFRSLRRGGIKSRKDYRRLHRLVKTRLVCALRELRDLADDSLRSLGAN